MKYLSIYIHIPYCVKKCNYCNFTSFTCCENTFEQYFKALEAEIVTKSKIYSLNKMVNTIFIGGGTPSLIPVKFIQKIMKAVRQNFKLTKNCEISIECNPDSTTLEKLQQYKILGINRISIGVQTLNNNQLTIIGRVHNRNKALDVIQQAKQVGFRNINADVMLGLPTQTKHSALNTLKKLINTGISHISLYTLILEENTPLYNKVISKELNLPTEDEVVNTFSSCLNLLKKNNFNRYEVANFSKPNKECKHNQGYWQNKNYIGFGVSAHSKIDNVRFSNTSNLDDYINNKNEVKTEKLTLSQIREEKIMLGLRTNKGINLNLVKSKTEEIKILKNNKFIQIKNNKIVATKKGFYVLNQIILMLV